MSDIPRMEKVKAHYDAIAENYDQWKAKNSYYYKIIRSFVKGNVIGNFSSTPVLSVVLITASVLPSCL